MKIKSLFGLKNRNVFLKKGYISIEFLLNFLIYLIVFIFLFTLAVIPIKIFYLKIAARDAAILYTELVHFSGANDLYSQAEYIMNGKNKGKKPDLNNVPINGSSNETIPPIKIEGTYRKDVGKVVSYYITKDLFQKNTLSSFLFNPEKITINIDDGGYAGGDTLPTKSISGIKKFFQGFVYSFGLNITIKYPITLFRVINLKLISTQMVIQGSFYVRYNK